MSSFSANTNRADVLLSGKNVSFISSSDDKFEVPVEYAILSDLVKDSLSFNEDDLNPEVPLPNISSPTLAKVIEFMIEYSKEPFESLPKPIPKNGLNGCVRHFYNQFLSEIEIVSDSFRKQSIDSNDSSNDSSNNSSIEEVKPSHSSIMEILLAATFLQIIPLKQLCTAYIAYQMREKNFLDIKKMFKCTDLNWDYKKMDELHKDHAWCFEERKKQGDNTSSSGGGGN
jgi:hypothetical protein